MNIITRKFSAAPVRTAAATWVAIVDVLSEQDATIRNELMKIDGIVASLISEGTPEKNAITIIGTGPRLRIYCLYEEDGSTENANESTLNWNPFENDWEIYLPVEQSDMDWITKSLSAKGSRFKVYQAGTKLITEEEIDNNSQRSGGLTINISKL